MKHALMKTIQYLIFGAVLLIIFKFLSDVDITPYAIGIAVLSIIVFLFYFFKDKYQHK